MNRPLLWIVALLIAAAPVAADVCRLDCARDRRPECPLHQQAPHTCTHDHTIGTAELTRASVDTARPIILLMAATPADAAVALVSIDLFRAEPPHAPPHRSSRPDVLRI